VINGARSPGRRHVLLTVAATAIVFAALYGALPQIPELRDTLERFDDGSPEWLLTAIGLEVASFAGYVIAFRAAFADHRAQITWRASTELTLAGVVASRLLAAGGAGGIAVTAWALHRVGLGAREVRERLAGFLVALYAVYMLALVLGGTGLRTGVLPGSAPFGLTVIPALFGGGVIVAALALSLVPPDLDRRVAAPTVDDDGNSQAPEHARTRRTLALLPATVSAGVREALRLLRGPTAPGLVAGALLWWACDIAVLWACFRAFGTPAPEVAVLVVAYFTGMLGNLIPLPGGVGGVEGGMAAALLGFGVAAGPAVLAVLTYRLVAFWLPIAPGAFAYARLRRRTREWDAALSPER